MTILKNIGLVLSGVFITFLIFYFVVTIASSINGIAVGEQITEWFGSIGTKASEVADVVDTVSNTSNLI